MDRELIVGAAGFLNAAPLTYGFRHTPGVTVVDAPPSSLAARVRSGELDLALVPVVDVLFNADLDMVDGLGVCACGPVRSVKLRCYVPLDRVREVVTDPASNTSNNLARLLFLRHFKQPVVFRENAPSPVQARVIIGDPALADDADCVDEYDLAEQWQCMTGLPFVFAVWACRRSSADATRIRRSAEQSLKSGQEHHDAIVREYATKLALSPEAVRTYIEGTIHYELGAREREAMQMFKRLLEEEHISMPPTPGSASPNAS